MELPGRVVATYLRGRCTASAGDWPGAEGSAWNARCWVLGAGRWSASLAAYGHVGRLAAPRGPAGRPAGAAAVPGRPRPDLVGPPLTGLYISTTTAGNWQDRIVAHGLGSARLPARSGCPPRACCIERDGESDIFVPVKDLDRGDHRARASPAR